MVINRTNENCVKVTKTTNLNRNACEDRCAFRVRTRIRRTSKTAKGVKGRSVKKYWIGYHKAGNIKSVNSILNDPSIIGINEMFGSSRPTRLVFDIDGLPPKKKGRMISKIKKVVTFYLNKLNIRDNMGRRVKADFNVYERDTNKKGYSLHIIEKNHIFSDSNVFRYFIKPFAEIINERVKHIHEIDLAIYADGKSLRLPWANKVDRDFSLGNEFELYEGDPNIRDPMNYLVQPHMQMVMDKGMSLINVCGVVVELNKLYTLTFPDKKYYEYIESGSGNRESINDDDVEEMMSILEESTSKEWRLVNINYDSVIVALIDRQGGCHCCDGKIHDNQNWSLYKRDDSSINLWCFASSKNTVLRKGSKKVKDSRAVECLESAITLPDSIKIEEEYIDHLEGEGKELNYDMLLNYEEPLHVAIKSNTGTGKTTWAVKLMIKAVEQGKRVLIIAPLRSLSKMIYVNLVNELKELQCDVGYYQNDNDFKEKFDVFITTPESLSSKVSINYDVVIYDEITSILASFPGKTMSNRLESFILKNKHIQENSDLSIMIDAQLKRVSRELIAGKKIMNITNTLVVEVGTVEKENDENIQKSKMIKMFREWRKFVYASNSATKVEEWENTLRLEEEAIIQKANNTRSRRRNIYSLFRPKQSAKLEAEYIHLGCLEARIMTMLTKLHGDEKVPRYHFESPEVVALRAELIRLTDELEKSADYKKFNDAERIYHEKVQEIIANKDNKVWWDRIDVFLYSPSIMVGLDFNTDNFEKIFCRMQNDILDVFQTVQMIRRFRSITNYNMYIDGKRSSSIFPLMMRETARMSDRDMAIALSLPYNLYSNFDPQTKTILKDNLVCKNASKANYKEMVYHFMNLQGITPIDSEPLDDKHILDDMKKVVEEKVQLSDSKEQTRINASLCSRGTQLRCIREYKKHGNVSVRMDHKTVLATFLIRNVCGVNCDNVNIHKTIELPMLLKQKLSKYKDDQLSDRVCNLFYKKRSNMDKVDVEDLLNVFKYMCKDDKTTGYFKFNQNKNLHVYERLGFYAGIGLQYKQSVVRRLVINDTTKQIKIPQVYVTWDLGNLKRK